MASEEFSLPDQGYVFWPVGTGDSTTICIDANIHLQVDLRHQEASNDEDDPHWPVVTELAKLLPKRDGRPFLSTFLLTHPDQDHCYGFEKLLDEVTIGELWFSPRVFDEHSDELCDDAIAFKEEAEKRVRAACEGTAGDERIRVIGYSDVIGEKYPKLPKDLISVPGSAITSVNGEDVSAQFRAFIHAPFKENIDKERNDSSVGMQVSLVNGEHSCRAMLLGDLANETINRIFDSSEEFDVEWDILLAPHHCSKTVMYTETDGDETLDQALMDRIESAGSNNGWIVSSSEPIPSSDEPGQNPPHSIAKRRYQEIVLEGHFVCTQEHPDEAKPKPLVFATSTDGCVPIDIQQSDANSLSAAVRVARGTLAAPARQVGFGD